MKKYIVIKEFASNTTIEKFDVTGKTDRQIEKIERGININLHEDCYTVVAWIQERRRK